MKRYIKHLIILAITIASVIPNAFAEVDVARSFYILRNDSAANGFVEGGEWLIEFSNKDTLGYEYDYPVAMNFKGAYYGDSTFIPMQSVDSVQFEQPSTIMKPGVFELTEEHYQYIVDTDVFKVIRFRIDCIAKIDLPKVGQKVISEIYKEPLPLGFLGQVESIKVSYDEGCIVMTCKPIRLSEVYDRLYKVDVLGDESENDSLPENVTKSRRLCPLDFDDYDENDKIEIIDKGKEYPFPDIGLIEDDDDFKFTFTPQSASSPMKFYAINNTFHSKSYNATIIDAQNEVDYTEVITEYTLKTTVGLSVDGADDPNATWNKKYGNVAPLKYKFSPAPKVLYEAYGHNGEKRDEAKGWVFSLGNPGAYARLDLGLLVSLAIDMTFNTQETFEFGIKTGYREKGSDITPIFEKTGDDLFFNHLDFNFGWGAAFDLKLGPYVMVQIGVPAIVELWGEICAGLNLKGGIDTNLLGIGESYDAKESTIDKLKTELDILNNSNYFNLQVGLMFDGKVGVLKGMLLDLPYMDWLRKVPAIKNAMDMLNINIFSFEGVPNYSFTNNSTNSVLSGTFKSKDKFLLNHDLYLMLKDAYLSDEDPKYIELIRLGEFDFSDGKVNHSFSIPAADKKYLKGIPLKIYSLMKANVGRKFCSTGKIADFEFPYESKLSNFDTDGYNYLSVGIDVDPDAFNDVDYTQTGVLMWETSQKEEDGTHIIGAENNAVSTSLLITRDNFKGVDAREIDFYIKPYVYDAKRSRYVYGEQQSAVFKNFYTPKTGSAIKVSSTKATIEGSFIDECNLPETGIIIGVSYRLKYTNDKWEEKEFDITHFKDLATTKKFQIELSDLFPGATYEYDTYLKYDNGSVNNIFTGEKLNFSTKPIFTNIKAVVEGTSIIFTADVDPEFAKENSRKSIFVEMTNREDEFFESDKSEIHPSPFETENSDGSITISADFYNTKLNNPYRLRAGLTTLNNKTYYSDHAFATVIANDFKVTTGSAIVAGNAAWVEGLISGHLHSLLKEKGIDYIYFDYSKNADMTESTTIGVPVDVNEIYHALLSDLDCSTTYYYKLYVQTISDSDYGGYWEGDVRSFKTDETPETNMKATTGSADGYAEHCNLEGSLSPNLLAQLLRDDTEFVYFDYSTKADMTEATTVSVPLDGIKYATSISGLKGNTKYYYRFYAYTASNNEYSGEVRTFEVGYLTDLKARTEAAYVNGNSVTIHGSLTPALADLLTQQGVDKVYFMCFDSSLSQNSNSIAVEFNGGTDYSLTIPNLEYGKSYVYTFYVFDANSNAYKGDNLIFSIPEKNSIEAGACSTLDADVNDADVTMYGEMSQSVLTLVMSNENSAYGFEVSERKGNLMGKEPTFAVKSKDYLDPITGVFAITKVLQPNTTYYIRAMVFFNDKWVAAPEVVSVKTANFDPNLKPPEIAKQ